MMDHFESSQWVDYVRGLGRAGERSAMETHLSRGCRKCGDIVRVLGDLAAISRVESEIQVPEQVVRNARAIWAMLYKGVPKRNRGILARLVSDNFREPLMAGLRTRQRTARQVLYQTANHSLDLRLEHQRGSDRVTLVGQVVSRKEHEKLLANRPVFLVREGAVVAHTLSNDFGEFQMEYRPQPRLRLYIQADQGIKNRIEVPLNGIGHRPAVRQGARPD